MRQVYFLLDSITNLQSIKARREIFTETRKILEQRRAYSRRGGGVKTILKSREREDYEHSND